MGTRSVDHTVIVAFDLVIRNGTLVSSSGQRRADLGIVGEQIAAVEEGLPTQDVAAELDATGLFLIPGVIDGHVHFREPGLEHEETWATGSRAAVFGGVTTVLDMPNTMPPTDTVERAQAKLALAQKLAVCNFGIFGLVGESLNALEELANSGLVVGLKVFMGPTTGDLRAPDNHGLMHALTIAHDANLRVAFHAEDREIVERTETTLRASGRTDALAHLEARPVAAEVAAIDRAGKLLRETMARGHILHLSSELGLAAVEYWRTEGVDLTCEVTPHHLLLDRDAYESAGSVARVNPPIRGGRDAEVLREALTDGRIDSVASDHAPHPAADKLRKSIWDAPSGFAGTETLLPLLLTRGVSEGWLSLERLVQITSEAPARIWSLGPRTLDPGSIADLAILNLKHSGTIEAARMRGLNNLSPFEGMAVEGAPIATIVRGSVVVRP
jgi:dihydroorotase (multifunctional complex type)